DAGIDEAGVEHGRHQRPLPGGGHPSQEPLADAPEKPGYPDRSNPIEQCGQQQRRESIDVPAGVPGQQQLPRRGQAAPQRID
nr:hypothetical protein [Tanacetum cinerariifolium]